MNVVTAARDSSVTSVPVIPTATNASDVSHSTSDHRRRSSGNFGEDIFARNYVWKVNEIPELYTIFAHNIFSPEFWEQVPSPAPVSMRLCLRFLVGMDANV